MESPFHLNGGRQEPNQSVAWYVYMVECGDGSIYTGIATDVQRRFAEHVNGGLRAAKYVKGRGPLRLMLERNVGSRSLALQVEGKIKRLSRSEKEAVLQDAEIIGVLVEELRHSRKVECQR